MNDEVKREADVISTLLERRVEPRKNLDWSHTGSSEQEGLRGVEHSAWCLIDTGDEMQRLSGDVLLGLLQSVQILTARMVEYSRAKRRLKEATDEVTP